MLVFKYLIGEKKPISYAKPAIGMAIMIIIYVVTDSHILLPLKVDNILYYIYSITS